MKLFRLHIVATALALLAVATTEMSAQSTQRVVTGVVSEMFGTSAEPLIGVNITVVNSQDRSLGGTVTNINGQYNLAIPQNEQNLTLVFSYIGMKTRRVKYSGQKTLNLTMESMAQAVGEVQITAERLDKNDMGVGMREQTAATQKINLEDLVATSPVTSVEEVLQGQLSGVDISIGGDPGAKSTFRIRGTSTLNGSSDPLIVIDGVPYSTETSDFDFANANEEDLGALINVSPNDIESVEVLKDASATAIWGTKGANGVLVINTKKGKVGKTRFTFSSKWTAKVEPSTIPMLNGDEYVALMQDALWNTANNVGVSQAGTYLDRLFNTPEITDTKFDYYDEYHQDTDWLSLVRQNALTSDNSISMSGGGSKATYRLSLGYMNEGGTTIGTSLDRFNASLRLDYRFSNKLKFGANYSYSIIDKDANWATTVRSEAFKKMPNKSPYIIDDATGTALDQYFTRQTGNWEGKFTSNDSGNASNYNPVAMAYESENNTKQRKNNIKIDAEYKILPGLVYRGWVSINMGNNKNTKFLPQIVTGAVWIGDYANQSYDSMSESLSIGTENRLQYSKDWKQRHHLIANLVWRTSQSTSSSYVSKTSGMASSEMSDPVIGSSIQKMAASESESRSVEGVAMASYTLLGRYVAQATLGIESNSAMGRNQRMGYFPSLGVNWNIQDEPWLKNAREGWLGMELAKLRFSYGQSGKAPRGNSIYVGAFKASDNGYMNMSSIVPDRIQLDQLKWETSTEYNLGFDASFFNGRLRFTFDKYWKTTEDLLQRNFKIPSTTGYSSIAYYNSGSSQNEGWEFRTDMVFLQNKDWRVSGYINLARNQNKITEMPMNREEGTQNADVMKNGNNYSYIDAVGRPIGSFFGYRSLGVYSDKESTYARDAEGNVMNDINGNPIIMKNGKFTCYPGDAKYEDINHDGVINSYDIVYLGNSQPILTGGAGITVKYKRVSLSAFFHGRFGQSIVNTARMSNEAMSGSANQSKAVLRRWRNEGDVTDIPRALYGGDAIHLNYLPSDRFVEKASFLRLKTLSLNYAFPNTLCKKLGVNSLSIFATGYNLFTWTDYTGQDPEVSVKNNIAEDSATTPVAKRFSFGLNLSF